MAQPTSVTVKPAMASRNRRRRPSAEDSQPTQPVTIEAPIT